MAKLTRSPLVWAVLTSFAVLAPAVQAQETQAGAAAPSTRAQGATAAPAAASAGSAVQQLGQITVQGTVDDLESLDFYAPNSSAVISRDDIDRLDARKVDQALQYEAGILSEPFGPDNKVDWFKIRGFDASTSIDGTPTTPNGYFVWSQNPFGLESIEVLKGPSSVVFGASETGGAVNLVTKRPHKQEALRLGAEVGNRDRQGLNFDYNGIANEQGNVYYRIVAQARREDGMQHRTKMKDYYLAPSLTIDFSDRTSLTLLASLQRDEGIPTNGFLPGYGTIIDTPYGHIDRRLNPGEPDFDSLKRTQISAGWLFSHEFADGWAFKQNYRFSRLSINQHNVFAYGSDNDRELLRGYTYTDGTTKNHYIDNRVTGTLQLGKSVRILPVIGFDYLHSDTTGDNNGFGLAPNLDMFSPVYGQPFPVSASPYDINARQLGLYAATQVLVGSHWTFNAGIRHDRANASGAIAGADAGYDVSHNSFNTGLMYTTDFGVSPYVSYSESFKPQPGVDSHGSAYLPYEGRQTEVGVKLDPDWLNGTLTLAYFDIKEKNALVADASNIQTQSGKRTNNGFEVQGDFHLTSDTTIKASYTYNHARQDISDSETVRAPLIPRHQASVWLSQGWGMPRGGRLTTAVGVRYNGATEDQHYYPGDRVPSYTLVDAMARYQIDRSWALQLNARNLTDKTYVSACDFYCYYGNGRTIDMQLQYQWQ